MEGNKIVSPLKAIKVYCYRCSGDSHAEVKRCTGEDCPLFMFRMGKNPYRKKKVLTEEQRNKAAERFAKARAKKQAPKSELE